VKPYLSIIPLVRGGVFCQAIRHAAHLEPDFYDTKRPGFVIILTRTVSHLLVQASSTNALRPSRQPPAYISALGPQAPYNIPRTSQAPLNGSLCFWTHCPNSCFILSLSSSNSRMPSSTSSIFLSICSASARHSSQSWWDECQHPEGVEYLSCAMRFG
jgi:hypothetical protein